MEALAEKHRSLIDGLTQLYNLLVALRYVRPHEVLPPPHTSPAIDVTKLASLGFEREVIDLITLLPHLSDDVVQPAGRFQDPILVAPETKPVGYLSDVEWYEHEAWRGAEEPRRVHRLDECLSGGIRRAGYFFDEGEEELPPWMFRLTGGVLEHGGVHFIYNVRDRKWFVLNSCTTLPAVEIDGEIFGPKPRLLTSRLGCGVEYHNFLFLPSFGPHHDHAHCLLSPFFPFPFAETITEWSPSQTLRFRTPFHSLPSRPTSAVLSDWHNNFYMLSWIPWEDYGLRLVTYPSQFFDLAQADPQSLHPTDAWKRENLRLAKDEVNLYFSLRGLYRRYGWPEAFRSKEFERELGQWKGRYQNLPFQSEEVSDFLRESAGEDAVS